MKIRFIFCIKAFHCNRERGFTLIELLVVVAIIGVLATFAITSLSVARSRSRDVKNLAESKQLQRALETYILDNNQLPSVISNNVSNCRLPFFAHNNADWPILISELGANIPQNYASLAPENSACILFFRLFPSNHLSYTMIVFSVNPLPNSIPTGGGYHITVLNNI